MTEEESAALNGTAYIALFVLTFCGFAYSIYAAIKGDASVLVPGGLYIASWYWSARLNQEVRRFKR